MPECHGGKYIFNVNFKERQLPFVVEYKIAKIKKTKISHGFRQEVASMDISLHETAVAQETVYEVDRVLRWDPGPGTSRNGAVE